MHTRRNFLQDKVVLVTTTKEGDPQDLIAKSRARLALETAETVKASGYQILSVDGNSSDYFVSKMKRLDVQLIPEIKGSMGSIRRQAIKAGFEAKPQVKYIAWLEPEKVNLIQFINRAIVVMEKEKSVLCLFNRKSLATYPREQQDYYSFVRATYGYLAKEDLDYGFGPMILSSQASMYFLEYKGEYGDLWDSILIPRLRVIHAGLPYSIIQIDFRNHPIQTKAETGRIPIILKRVEQLSNVAQSLVREYQKLHGT